VSLGVVGCGLWEAFGGSWEAFEFRQGKTILKNVAQRNARGPCLFRIRHEFDVSFGHAQLPALALPSQLWPKSSERTLHVARGWPKLIQDHEYGGQREANRVHEGSKTVEKQSCISGTFPDVIVGACGKVLVHIPATTFRSKQLSKIDVKIYKLFAVLLGGSWMHFGTNVGRFVEAILGIFFEFANNGAPHENNVNSGRFEGRAPETPTKNYPKRRQQTVKTTRRKCKRFASIYNLFWKAFGAIWEQGWREQFD
jgi:hypothetical protein